jgi:hypothetical protein
MSNRKSSRYNSMTPRNINPTKCVDCELLRLEMDVLTAKLNHLTAQVTSQGNQLTSQGNQLTSQGNQLTALEGTVLIDWIRNVIASVLLVLAGEQPYPYSSSNRFKKATGDFLSRVTRYVNNSQWEINKFKKAADEVILRRNKATHPASVNDLDGLVIRAKEAIHNCPSITQTLKNESIMIADYDDIKKFFPFKKPL